MTIKFSAEQLARFGFNTQEELLAKLEKANQPPPAPPAPAVATLEAFEFEMASAKRQAAMESRLTSIEATLKTFSAEAILASVAVEAKRVASSEVSAAIARSGGAALGQKSDPTEPPAGKPAIDPNDFGAQYDSTPAIREEFVTKAGYVKYMEAMSAGRIRTHAAAQRN